MFLAVLDEYCGAPAAPAPPRLGGDRASSGRAAETADAGVALGGGCDTFTFSPDVARAAVGALAARPPPRPAAGTCAKRGEYGSAEDRWASRCTVEAIQIDQANGCTVACGCVQRLSLAEIQDQRTQRMNERGAGRREFLRTYFEHNRNLECRFGYELHTQDASKRILCTTGFAVCRQTTGTPRAQLGDCRPLAADRTPSTSSAASCPRRARATSCRRA